MKSYHVYWITSRTKTRLTTTKKLEQAYKKGARFIERQKGTNWKMILPERGEPFETFQRELIVGWFIPKTTGKVEEIVIHESETSEIPEEGEVARHLEFQLLDSARQLQFEDQKGAYKVVVSRLTNGGAIGFLANYYQRLRWRGDSKMECDIIQFIGARERDVLQQCMDWLHVNAEPSLSLDKSYNGEEKHEWSFSFEE